MTKLSEYIHFKEVEGTQFPKNLEFYSTNEESEYREPGIFFLHYRGELIYIGFTNNDQHLIKERIVRQIATITLRDYRILFTDAAFKELGKKDEIKTYFTLTEPEIGTKDFVTSVNRVKYAAQHWDEFKNLNKDVLGRFEFEWFPNPVLGGHPDIKALCTSLKMKYKPRCNQEYRKPSIK
jgi:hypothetical protein